jgi:transmembrane sensor
MEEAIGWTIRLRDARAGEWEEFAGWLEADPEHLRVYEEVALADADAAALLPLRQPPPAEPQPWGRHKAPIGRRLVLGGAAAAAIAATFGYVSLVAPRDIYAIETARGQRRTVALDGGTKIELNGASKILLDRKDVRFARLERGEAWFEVVHQADDPFRVEAGPAVVRNVGTKFNVLHEGETIAVEVAEGAVLFSSDGEEIGLSAGQAAQREAGQVTTTRREASSIGGWRGGQLNYASASYAQIARDLSRSSGVEVRAAPEVAARRFSGVIAVDPDRELMRRRLAALLEVNVRVAGEGWILAPPDR